MLIVVAAIIAGFIILTWSADRFVAGAAATAYNLNISPILIGLTVVSIGTSAPEILVSSTAAIKGFPALAIGNAIGSNIVNLAVVLGVTALIAPLPVKSGLVKKEIPLLLAVSVLAGACLADGHLGLLDAIALLSSLVVTLYLMIRWQLPSPHDSASDDDDIPHLPSVKAAFYLISGLLFLLGSSQLLVWGATEVATLFGVSELVIGLTIVAIGTSLPELAASIASALKGQHDIALGNVIGSNLFNILAVLSMPGLFAPSTLENSIIWRDYPVMMGLTLFVTLMCFVGKKPNKLGRMTGTVLLLSYVGYTFYLVVSHG